ncbi:MAG: B12-binding domain-containing radical SAM protein [Thermodesulfatator sp.]|nr:MAG: B12-binding domain-containing radical SAM protein [Thermodesulfatator sp.]
MRIHIIQPTHFDRPFSRKLFKTRARALVPLTLPYLASLVPPGHEIKLTDEQIEELDFNMPCDCVFITSTILTSFRAYEIADQYRAKGIPVVIGGPHCTFYADEVENHADAVVQGEGEIPIPLVINDLEAGHLKRHYKAERLHDLHGLPFPRYDLLSPSIFSRFPTYSVQTTRGCPYRCEFCAERYHLGERYRMRPVEEVIEEIKYTGCRQIFFADSTFAGNRSRTMELMERLIPLKIRWSTLWNTNRCLDDEFMELAKKSGLLHINMGVESINRRTLENMNKKTTPAGRLTEVTQKLRKLGISFSFNLIFGWDTDNLEDFDATLKFLVENKVHVAFFNVFSPHKGTKIYDRYLSQGRLRDPYNMGRWPGVIAEIYPRNYSPEELEENVLRLYREFYSWSSMLRRLPLPVTKANIASWFMNLQERKLYRGNTHRANFDGI